tara:strand:+ start:9147 stop:9719 length:573 start_codon:yes stop_codon:yes gene_type:complete
MEKYAVITQHPETGEYDGWSVWKEGDDWFSGTPLDGGMGYKLPKKYIVFKGTRSEMREKYDTLVGDGWREAIIDSGWHEPVKGYLRGNARNGNRTWNGWANPAFPLESIKQLAKQFDEGFWEAGYGDRWDLNEEDWSMKIVECDEWASGDPSEEFPPYSEWSTIDVATDDGIKKVKVLHCPGAGYTWDEQ